MTIEYLGLADYLAIAAAVTDLDIDTVIKVTNLDLADSALHAPSAGFGATDFYPDFVDKAAVLVVRLAKNHPLPDGNKRAAWVSLRAFVDMNGWTWAPKPDIDEAEQAVLAIASGEWAEDEAADWLRRHLTPPVTSERPTPGTRRSNRWSAHSRCEVLRYRLRSGSSGAGEFPGGEGVKRDVQVLEDCTVSLITERRLRAPWGPRRG